MCPKSFGGSDLTLYSVCHASTMSDTLLRGALSCFYQNFRMKGKIWRTSKNSDLPLRKENSNSQDSSYLCHHFKTAVHYTSCKKIV